MADWDEHLIIKTLSRNDSLANKIIPELSIDHFISTPYRKTFKRILSFYGKSGRILTWKELLHDPVLSDKIITRLKSREIKRKALVNKDAALRLPININELKVIFENLVVNSQYIKLIDLQNKLSDKLKDKKMNTEEVEGIISLCSDNVEKIQGLKGSSGAILKTTELSPKEAWNLFSTKLRKFCVPTGFKNFDSVNVGIPKDSLWVISAPSGAGKSTVAMQVGMNAYRLGAKVCIVSLEMSVEQILLRIAANLTGISKDDINKNPDMYRIKIKKAFKKFFKPPTKVAGFDLYIPGGDDDISDVLMYLKPQDYDIIFIDYISLLAPMHGDVWRSLDLSARFGKVYATNNETIICLIAQWDEEKDNIRYAKALREHSSNLWKWLISQEQLKETGLLNIQQPKARNQNPLDFTVRMSPAISKVEDVDVNDLYTDDDDGTTPITKEFED
jgi:archaellum biogenesis ATPase FlaH